LTRRSSCGIINTERERKGQNKMAIATEKYGIMTIRKGTGCGDKFMETVVLNGKEYDIYLGYFGYPIFYAVEKK
jgi:hypothetical protein